MKSRFLIIIGALILVGFTELIFAEDLHTFEIDGYDIITNTPNVSAINMDWNSEHLSEFSVNFTEPYTGQFQIQIPKNMPRMMNLDFETTLMLDVSSLSGAEQEKDWNEHIIEKDFKMIDDRVSETESLCHYIVTVELSETGYFKIVTGSVASGRWEPVTIENEECNELYDKTTKHKSIFPRHGFNAFQIPPLKQFKLGIPIDQIYCRDSLILVTKHDDSPACVKPETKQKLIEREWIVESEIKKLWKSTEDWNSLRLVRNDDGLYCSSANEEMIDHCYSLENIVFGDSNKKKETGWKLYPGGAGWTLPKNYTLTPIYKKGDFGIAPLNFTAMLDDKIFVNKCESNGGMWNYTRHDCEDLWEVCRDIGGIIIQEDVTPPCTDTGIIDDDPLTIKVCGGAGIIRASCVFEYEN